MTRSINVKNMLDMDVLLVYNDKCMRILRDSYAQNKKTGGEKHANIQPVS